MVRIEPLENRVYLKPGQMCVATRPTRITTVLGSCISVTLFHSISGIAAICHAVQPECKNFPNCSDQCIDEYKYVSCVIPAMIKILTLKGIRPHELESKLFGGAAVLWRRRPSGEIRAVGQMNVETAMKTISTNGLILTRADVGGSSGRKIIFDTRTGDVLLKRLGHVE